MRPYVFQHDALCFGDGMDVVGLEEISIVLQAGQQEGDPGDALFVRQALIDIMELFGVSGAVIGWQTHADQQDLGLVPLRRGDDGIEIGVHLRERQATQAVVTPQFHDDDIGMVPV